MKFPPPSQWLEALEAAATEVLTQGGGDPPYFDSSRLDLKVDSAGAYVSLVGPGHCVRVGILASRPALRRLAGAASMTEPTETETEEAACELVTLLAAAMRKFFDAGVGNLFLGLPVFAARTLPVAEFQVVGTEMSVHGASATLVVMLPGASSAN